MTIWIGTDPREYIAGQVCAHSIQRRWKDARIEMLDWSRPSIQNLYTRPYTTDHGQYVCSVDGRPFSTQFSFSRFLVPFLEDSGWHLFVDCDFLFFEDVRALFKQADDKYAVMVVKHDQKPAEVEKMDGVVQAAYDRKNWSSFILWNLDHPAHKRLTVEDVNTKPGSWLHQFRWLADHEIGEIDESWNWLVGVSPTTAYYGNQQIDPKAAHFTLGGPWFPHCRQVEFAEDWYQELGRYVVGDG